MPASPQHGGALRGRFAVVTGASRGIGLAVARALAAEGCSLALAARSSLAGAMSAVAPYGSAVLAQRCDIRDEADVSRFFAGVSERFGRIDVLVNNAGVSHAMHPVEELSLEDWQRNIDTNLTGMFLCTRAALPLMSAGGAIVNNLSVAARTVFAGEAAYCASKFGALGFTNTLREELRPRGIRVISLIAGATDTDIWNQFMPDAPREKMLRPDAIAQAVVDALVVPNKANLEEIVLMPEAGTL